MDRAAADTTDRDLDDLLDGLGAVIDGLAGIDTAGLSDDDLQHGLVDLHRLTTRLRHETFRLTAAYDTRRAWANNGSRSAVARLARDCRASRVAIGRQVRLGRRLRLMPLVAAAFAAGEITEDHVDVLARLAGSARKSIADRFGEAEELLLGYARGLEFADFLTRVRYWEQVVDQDGAEDQAADDHQARRLHVSEMLNGVRRIDGELDAIGGEIFANELERLEQKLFDQDWAQAKARHGDDVRVEDLARTPAQRRADALVVMAQRSATMPADGKTPAPLFTILVGYETFHGRLCQLASGTVVTPGQLAPWLDRAYIERIVFDGPSRVIDVGVHRRFFTGATRRAIEVRDRHCTTPGCNVPAANCDVDHITPASHGGLTTQDNGRLRCPPHNPTVPSTDTTTKTRKPKKPHKNRPASRDDDTHPDPPPNLDKPDPPTDP